MSARRRMSFRRWIVPASIGLLLTSSAARAQGLTGIWQYYASDPPGTTPDATFKIVQGGYSASQNGYPLSGEWDSSCGSGPLSGTLIYPLLNVGVEVVLSVPNNGCGQTVSLGGDVSQGSTMYCISPLPGAVGGDCGSSWIATLVPSVPVSLSPSSLSFTYQIGSGTGPPAQDLALSSNSPLAFSAATTGGSWLSVSPTQKATPATFSVVVNPVGFAPGAYTGSIVLTEPIVNGQQTIPVTLTIAPVPMTVSAVPIAVTNDASFATQISPGSIVALFGEGIATTTSSGFPLPLPTSSNGTSVTINGIFCPLIYVSASQVNLQAPMELQPGTATVVLDNNGQYFLTTVQVLTASPGIFTTDYYVNGGVAILQDSATGTILDASNPAVPGENVTIYFTGIGPITNNPGTGRAAPLIPLSQSTSAVSVTVNGILAQPSFTGLTPGFAGLGQVNFQLPANTPTGNSIPVALIINGVNSKSVQISVN